MVCIIILTRSFFFGATIIHLLTSVTLASGTIAGLGAYFLGLSSLSSSLHDDDSTKRVQKLKEELQTGSCIPRTDDNKICALYNLADPRTCPPDVPPDFKDGDEIGCKDTSSTQCVQATPDSNKPAVTCSTSTTRNDVTTPLPDGNFACTNFCFCQIEGEPRICTTPGPKAKREVQPVLNRAPEPTAAPMFSY